MIPQCEFRVRPLLSLSLLTKRHPCPLNQFSLNNLLRVFCNYTFSYDKTFIENKCKSMPISHAYFVQIKINEIDLCKFKCCFQST